MVWAMALRLRRRARTPMPTSAVPNSNTAGGSGTSFMAPMKPVLPLVQEPRLVLPLHISTPKKKPAAFATKLDKVTPPSWKIISVCQTSLLVGVNPSPREKLPGPPELKLPDNAHRPGCVGGEARVGVAEVLNPTVGGWPDWTK